MRIGHAGSLQWSMAARATCRTAPCSTSSLMPGAFAINTANCHPLSIYHGRSFLSRAATLTASEHTLRARTAGRPRHLRVPAAGALHQLSPSSYLQDRCGITRPWADSRLQSLRLFSSEATSGPALEDVPSGPDVIDGEDRDTEGQHEESPMQEDSGPGLAKRNIKYSLPSETSEKLGLGRSIRVHYKQGLRSSQDHKAFCDRIYNTLVQSVDDSSQIGLSCWAEALSRCSHELSPGEVIYIAPNCIGSKLTFSSASIPELAGDRHVSRAFTLRGVLQSPEPEMKLRLPHSVDFQSSIASANTGSNSIKIDQVTLYGRVDERRLSQATKVQQICTKREAAFLTSMAITVTKCVCKSMRFRTAGDALSAIAETMLRVLEFRSYPFVLESVHLISKDTASRKQCVTRARWKTGVSGAQDEVAITSDDRVIARDQDHDGHMTGEDHDENTEDVDVSADAGIDASHPSASVPEVAFNGSGAVSLQSDDQSAVTLAADGQDLTLDESSFGAREQEHVHVPLHQNKLVVQGPRGITLSCNDVRSKRIEARSGFHSVRFKLTWSPEQWSAVADITILDLAKAIEDYFAAGAQDSVEWWSDPTKALQTTLPGHPKVQIGLTREPEKGSRKSRLKGQTRVQFWSDPTHGTHIVMPKLVIEHVNPGLFKAEPAQHVMVGVSLTGSAVAAQDKDSSFLAAIRFTVGSLEPLLTEVMRDPLTKSLDNAAQLIAWRILHDTQVSAGLLQLEMVSCTIAPHIDGRDRNVTKARAIRSPGEEEIFVALGSNVGDRVGAIEDSLRVLDGNDKIKLLQTSPLYETEPMYVEDQERFLNGVCKIETQLAPIELLDTLQAIEKDLGRVKLIDKGPRNIDLDIVAYGQQMIESDRLIVPHRLMQEREFVLRPLCDIARDFHHPQSHRTMSHYLGKLPPSSTSMYPLTPLAPGLDLRALDPARKTMVMSILNVTPDSFSDGGINQPADLEALKATAASHIAAGARIIDIGGQSSRPNAPDVTPEEEIARILPAIEAIKSLPEAANTAISIDTYRASVAEAAIKAGAHIINDISAGTLDPEMLPTVARLGCTYIMMHMRGTPATMQNDENTTYSNGLIPTIATELLSRLKAAESAGIRRWRIVLDPGIGFAKTIEQNLELLRDFHTLRQTPALRTYPWLVGSSRKGFIGKITGVEKAADRVSGTAATVTAAVQGGAEIVRVHDVEEMGRVVKMADAMYRVKGK